MTPKPRTEEVELLLAQKQARETELVPAEPQQSLAPIKYESPAIIAAQMMQQVIDKGITAENVGVMEKLVGLLERMDTKKSEQLFNEGFVALQREMPRVQAKQPVPNNDGTVRYKFAPYEQIMEQIQPFLVKHGFTVSFSTKYGDARIIKVCTLRHTAGHHVDNEFAVRIGKGPPGSSEAQADGAAGTYARRHALCDALNIVVESDDDGRAMGGKISQEQASELRKRVQATGSDEKAFLKYAQAATFEDIEEGNYAMLDHNLKRKESVK